MMKLNKDVVHFLQNQGFVVVSTIDPAGYPHNSCKGIVEIDEEGRVFLLDLFHARTRKNLEANPLVSVTAVDEHKFAGYCLKGKARIVAHEEMNPPGACLGRADHKPPDQAPDQKYPRRKRACVASGGPFAEAGIPDRDGRRGDR